MQKEKKLLLFVVLFIIPLGGMGIDLYSPSLPYIETYMKTSHTLVKLSISLYLYGYALGQFIFGTVSDSLGRKKPLVFGLFCYVIISLICTQIQDIHWLLLLRVIQGFSVAASVVISKAILGDCFKGEALAKATSLLITVWGLGPILAPLIGGYLQYHINWQANFYFFFGYGLLSLLLVIFILPETHFKRKSFKVKATAGKIIHMLTENKLFIIGTVLVAIGYAILVSFNLMGPYLVQKVLNYNAAQYGHIAFVLGLSFFIGSVTNRMLLAKYKVENLLKVSVVAFFLISIVMQIWTMLFTFNLAMLVIPTLFIFFISGWMIPNALSQCMTLYPEHLGTANAVISFLLLFIASSITVVLSAIPAHSMMVLSLAYCVLAAIGIVIIFMTAERNKHVSGVR